MKNLAILGSTGSIGVSTLSVVDSYPDRFQVTSLAAGSNLDSLFEQCKKYHPKIVSVATEPDADSLRKHLISHGLGDITIGFGTVGSVAAATHSEVNFVVSAIVGVAGLEATYEAVKAGKAIGLANKECLVAAGDLITAEAARKNVPLLPIDSEHNAVHQCLRGGHINEVEKIWLTASGGPFRNTPVEDFPGITVERALNHPTWKMGRRITIDSATLMNKGFEVIEACRLFDLPPRQVEVIIHPQSTIHSLVEFNDGSILAQISVTDMRLPILYALTYPDRIASDLRFDLKQLQRLDFQNPDLGKFPCLRLAYEAVEAGGAKTIALNSADEIAVAAFLDGQISFHHIPKLVENVLEVTSTARPASIAEVLSFDSEAREEARRQVTMLGGAVVKA